MNARDLQEPVLRWVATAVFAGCAVGFCWSLGEVEMSTSFGLFFGALFAGVPGGLLWARYLAEATIRSERAAVQPASGQLRLMARPDVDDAPTAQRSQSSGYYDDDED